MFVKFCGFTNIEDLAAVKELKSVNAVGYIFYEKSERCISPQKAAELTRFLKGSGLKTVGIFVDQNVDEIRKIAEIADLDILQIYRPEYIEELQKDYEIFACMRIQNSDDVKNLPDIGDRCRYLLDARSQKHMGGSGDSFDWDLLDNFPFLEKAILAGGISEKNIRRALAIKGLYGIDLSSGIEDSPGKKSKSKMEELDKIIQEELYGTKS